MKPPGRILVRAKLSAYRARCVRTILPFIKTILRPPDCAIAYLSKHFSLTRLTIQTELTKRSEHALVRQEVFEQFDSELLLTSFQQPFLQYTVGIAEVSPVGCFGELDNYIAVGDHESLRHSPRIHGHTEPAIAESVRDGGGNRAVVR